MDMYTHNLKVGPEVHHIHVAVKLSELWDEWSIGQQFAFDIHYEGCLLACDIMDYKPTHYSSINLTKPADSYSVQVYSLRLLYCHLGHTQPA